MHLIVPREPSGPHQRHSGKQKGITVRKPTLALAGVVAILMAGCGPAAASAAEVHASTTSVLTADSGPVAGSRAEATGLAGRALSRLHLPASARRITTVIPILRLSAEGPASTDSVYVSWSWRIPMPVNRVQDYLRSHVPAGLTGDGPGGTLDWGSYSVSSAGYAVTSALTPVRLAPGIYEEQIGFATAPAGSGAELRASVLVTWYPPRSAAEYVSPARYHSVTVSATLLDPELHTVSRTFTSAAVIAQLAGPLNQANAMPAGLSFLCPREDSILEVAFATAPGARPDVVVRGPGIGCGGATITVDGRSQPPLLSGFAVTAASLLGLRT
jgi:hypothetical protein